MSNKYLKRFIRESIDHQAILDFAESNAGDADDVIKIETLSQNIVHMTIALNEVETRLVRVSDKMKRYSIEEVGIYTEPLESCVLELKSMIERSENSLNEIIRKRE